MEDRKFGLGVIICVFNRDFSKILLLKRNEEKRKKSGADWGNVGGRVEIGEMLIDACLREAREEIGVNLNQEKLKLVEIKETPHMSEVFHAIHFVYATILDENEKIILNFDCDNESEDYQWFDLKNLPAKTLDPKEYLIKLSTIARREFSEDEK
jgi:ADP-ribose pyrophosphatase YjhB (NUDIX family)